MAAALESETLVASKVGGGNLRDMAYAASDSWRTSSSVLLDAGVQAAHPRLQGMAQALQSKGLRVRWEAGVPVLVVVLLQVAAGGWWCCCCCCCWEAGVLVLPVVVLLLLLPFHSSLLQSRG